MKKLTFTILLAFISLLAFSQKVDSVKLEINNLKKEIVKLQKSASSMNAQLKKLKATHKEDLTEIEGTIGANSKKMAELEGSLAELKTQLEQHSQDADARISALEKWSKSMAMIQLILFGVLFLFLLVFVILNRMRINKESLKLEALAMNSKEQLELEIKTLTKKHEDDMAELKKALEEKKK